MGMYTLIKGGGVLAGKFIAIVVKEDGLYMKFKGDREVDVKLMDRETFEKLCRDTGLEFWVDKIFSEL